MTEQARTFGDISHVTLVTANFDESTLVLKVDGDMPVIRGRKFALVNAADLLWVMQAQADMRKTITEQKQQLAALGQPS